MARRQEEEFTIGIKEKSPTEKTFHRDSWEWVFLIPFWVEIIGFIAGFLGVIAWVPQIKRVWSEKKHDGISLPTFTLVSTSLVLWLVYGIVIGSVAMTLALSLIHI